MPEKIPSWEDVGIPQLLVSQLSYARDETLVLYLVERLVFHQENKVSVLYVCGNCGNKRTSDKFYDEYTECTKCQSKIIRASFFYKNNKDNFTKTVSVRSRPMRIIEAMGKNYATYFKVQPVSAKETCSIEYVDNSVGGTSMRCKFLGSNTYFEDTSVDFAISVAAILCPFIWSPTFNWTMGDHNPRTSLKLTHYLYQWLADDKPSK